MGSLSTSELAAYQALGARALAKIFSASAGRMCHGSMAGPCMGAWAAASTHLPACPPALPRPIAGQPPARQPSAHGQKCRAAVACRHAKGWRRCGEHGVCVTWRQPVPACQHASTRSAEA
eukprot:366458-Chlamydomonas_euryale.AAC.36